MLDGYNLTSQFLASECETPKSPPGDYNRSLPIRYGIFWYIACETPKSPPGDYNKHCMRLFISLLPVVCETPKSPPGDYNLTNSLIHGVSFFVKV